MDVYWDEYRKSIVVDGDDVSTRDAYALLRKLGRAIQESDEHVIEESDHTEMHPLVLELGINKTHSKWDEIHPLIVQLRESEEAYNAALLLSSMAIHGTARPPKCDTVERLRAEIEELARS